ncbi:g1985 [Coccomyxa elongata]
MAPVALAPGMCFDAACQAAMDRAFLTATTIPLLGLVSAIACRYRPWDWQKTEGKQAIEDPGTGAIFEGDVGARPEVDRRGNLAWRVLSYQQWPVEAGAEGDRVRVHVGPINALEPRTYVFTRTLPQPSKVLAVSLPRPMGVVLEEDARRGRIAVSGFVEGSVAEKRHKVAKLNRVLEDSSVLVGDVLRGFTCTNFVYRTQALFGAQAPQRTIVLYGADKQKWPQVMGALRKGDKSDGNVTLVVERRLERQDADAAEARAARFDY